MPDCYCGEIIGVAFNFVPDGWLACDGKTYPIDGNETLFSLLGTTYGGDGIRTFGVPDLRGRVPVSQGKDASYPLGQTGGDEQVTLLSSQIGAHNHPMMASSHDGGYWPPPPYPGPGGIVHAPGPGMTFGNNIQTAFKVYGTDQPLTTLALSSIRPAGRSLPHENRQPFLAINYIICSNGIRPTQ
jgi:microcystin-dependent protein